MAPGKSEEEIMRDPKLFVEKCYEDHAWCARFADTRLSKMTEEQLVSLNCGHKIVKLDQPCDPRRNNNFRESCARKVSGEQAILNCVKKDIVTVAFQSCLYPQRGGKGRDAPLSGDTPSSSTSRLAIWGSIGLLVFLLICALIAYVKGSKKGRKSGASKSAKSKSKMTPGKSNLGSRKSQTPSTSSSSRQSSKK